MAAGLVIIKGSLIPGVGPLIKEFDSNVTLARTDLVNVQSGKLEVADPGEAILGAVIEGGTITSSSTKVQVNATPMLTLVMDSNGSAIAATDAFSSYFDTTGGTGAQIVNTATRDAVADNQGTGQLMCVEYNPQGVGFDSDTSVGLFMIHEQGYAA